MKCGQPLSGPSHKRCREDISYLNACLQGLGKGRIIDVRSQHVAQNKISKGQWQWKARVIISSNFYCTNDMRYPHV